MRIRTLTWLLLAFLTTSLWGQQDEPRGAKEIFYDPAGDGGVLAVETEAPCKPPEAMRRASTVPDCERRRVSSETDANGALGLSYWIELVETPEGPGRQVTESRAFKSGEMIRLHFLSNRDGLISLLQLGSSGVPSMLFPDSEKGLSDQLLRAGQDRILPTPEAWFRFDAEPGTERIIVVFAADEGQLGSTLYREPRSEKLDSDLVRLASSARGRKDLMIETETENYAEIGTYAVSAVGKPVVLEIALEHE